MAEDCWGECDLLIGAVLHLHTLVSNRICCIKIWLYCGFCAVQVYSAWVSGSTLEQNLNSRWRYYYMQCVLFIAAMTTTGSLWPYFNITGLFKWITVANRRMLLLFGNISVPLSSWQTESSVSLLNECLINAGSSFAAAQWVVCMCRTE